MTNYIDEGKKYNKLIISPFIPDSNTPINSHVITLGYYYCERRNQRGVIDTTQPLITWSDYKKISNTGVIINPYDTIIVNSQEFIGITLPFDYTITTYHALMPYLNVVTMPPEFNITKRINLIITNKCNSPILLMQGYPIAMISIFKHDGLFTPPDVSLTDRFDNDQRLWNPKQLIPLPLKKYEPDGKTQNYTSIGMSHQICIPPPERDTNGIPILPKILMED